MVCTMELFGRFRDIMPFLVGYSVLEEHGFVAPNTFRRNLCHFASVLGSVFLIGGTVLVGGYFVFEAKTFEEFHDNFYEFLTGCNDSFYLIYIHCMCKQFFEMNAHFEKIIKKREFFFCYNLKWKSEIKKCNNLFQRNDQRRETKNVRKSM